MNNKTLTTFVKLANDPGSCSYNYENKEKFHRQGRAILKEVAKLMNLAPGTYEIRSNQGGIACSGEITLHGENIYIQLSQSCFPGQFMYRQCHGQKDYTGGRNCWMKFDNLLELDKAAITFGQVAKNG